jgi:S1-C subfamily serine protease
MRPIIWLGMVIGFWLFNVAGAADVNHTLALSVVQIQAYPKDGKAFVGSGVVLGQNLVATNCHITRHASAIVVGKGALRYRAASQRADVKHDLCILEAPGVQLPAASLGTPSGLSVGEPIYLYGYPRAIGIAFAEGRIEGLHPYDGSLIIETSAAFVHGASGGGIFDRDGRLVGLATFLSAGGTAGHYAIPADWIPGLMALPSQPVKPLSGSLFWENTSTLPEFLKRNTNRAALPSVLPRPR